MTAAAELALRLQQLDTHATDLTELLAALTQRADAKVRDAATHDAAAVATDLHAAADVLHAYQNALATAELDASTARSDGTFTADHRRRLKAAKARAVELDTRLQFVRAQHTRSALVGDATQADADTKHARESTAGAAMQHGRVVMSDANASLERTAALVHDSRTLAAATLVRLHAQTTQLTRSGDDVVAVDHTMRAADRTLRRLARRMAQDKVLGCLTAAVVGIIIFICIKKVP